MYREVSKLILYRNLGEDSILRNFSEIFKRFDSCHYRSEELITDIYREVKRLLDLATTYGFDKNLWHNYLTFVLITNENSFSLTSEKVGANDGTVNHFAKNDFQAFMHLFHYDFRPIEETLGIDCFSTLLQYKAVVKKERMYNKNVSEKVQALSDKLAAAEDVDRFFDAVVDFYKEYGVGMFGLNKAFRIVEREEMPELVPINNLDKVVLDDLTGYEIQKKLSRYGFEWESIDDVIDKVYEEMDEVKEAISENNRDHIEDELGDVFLTLVNLARYLKVRPDQALERANYKITSRFVRLCELAGEKGVPVDKDHLAELDELWNEVKRSET